MTSMSVLYKKKNFKIYSYGKRGYVIHNSNLEFSQHHTHLNNFNTCKFIIDLCIKKSIPDNLSEYLINSLIRLTNDDGYKYKLRSKITEINNKNRRRNSNVYR